MVYYYIYCNDFWTDISVFKGELKDMWKDDRLFIGLVIFFILAVIGGLWALMVLL